MLSDATTPAFKTTIPSGNEVLVVEDDPRVRNMLAGALKEMGFAGTFCASAEAGNRALVERSFDILILDLNLPGMGGIEFLERARKRDCDIEAIILTGFGDLDAAKKAIHLDVVEFLTKPCTLGSLEMALSRAKSRRKSKFVQDAAIAEKPVLEFGEDPAGRRPAFARELEQTCAAITALPADTAAERSLEESMEDVERRHIFAILRKHNGNRAATAAELGISVRKLYYRLGEYQRKGLTP
jgi:DNA-binding NtrC family response regulator